MRSKKSTAALDRIGCEPGFRSMDASRPASHFSANDQERVDDNPSYLSITETAKHLTVAYNTVRNLINRGELPARKFAKVYRIHRSDLAAFEARCLVSGPASPTVSTKKPNTSSSASFKHLNVKRLQSAWQTRDNGKEA